jgi:glycosyltransferase 2 family protein
MKIRSRLKSSFKTLFKVSFAVGLIYWLISTKKLNLEDVKPFLTWQGLLPGILLVGGNLFLLSERWRQLIKSHIPAVRFWPTQKLSLIGIFFNFAMPGGIGGDVIKAYYLQKELGSSRTMAFTSALIDRVIGLYTFAIMAILALVIEYFDAEQNILLVRNLLIWISILFVGLNFGLAVLLGWKWPERFNHLRGIPGKIFNLMNTCRSFIKNSRQILMAISLTVCAQFFTVAFFGLSLRSILGETIDWSTLFFIVPVGFMVMAIPLTPAGVGVGQAAFYFLFQNFAMINSQSGPAVVTAFQLIQFFWGLLGAYFYLTMRSLVDVPHTQKSH